MPLGLVHASACGTDVEIPLPHQGAGSLQAVSDCAGYTCEEEQVSRGGGQLDVLGPRRALLPPPQHCAALSGETEHCLAFGVTAN